MNHPDERDFPDTDEALVRMVAAEGAHRIAVSEDAVDEQRDISGFRFTDRVPDGGVIRPWHGMVRYNAETNELITAIIPLNLIGRALWRILFFLKMGGRSVNMDPRQAWHDGYLRGQAEERENAPTDIKLQRTIVEATRQRADNIMRRFGEHGLLQEKQDEFDSDLQAWFDRGELSEVLKAYRFPREKFDELQAEKARIRAGHEGATKPPDNGGF